MGAFFLRDLSIARSYRLRVCDAGCSKSLLGVAAFYYLSRFIQSPELARVACRREGRYFSFALVGFAFFDYLGVRARTRSISSLDSRRAKTAALEYLLVTQTSLPVILRRFRALSVHVAVVAHRRLSDVGHAAVRLLRRRRQTGWARSRGVGRVGAGVYWFRSTFCRPIHVVLKRGNPREVAVSRRLRRGERRDVSGELCSARPLQWVGRLRAGD